MFVDAWYEILLERDLISQVKDLLYEQMKMNLELYSSRRATRKCFLLNFFYFSDTEAPAAEKTRIKYERDFLLQLQYMPVCCEKPAGLPEIEIVLDAPLLPGKESGGSQR